MAFLDGFSLNTESNQILVVARVMSITSSQPVLGKVKVGLRLFHISGLVVVVKSRKECLALFGNYIVVLVLGYYAGYKFLEF